MQSVWDLIFPRTCYSCGQSGSYLCLACQSQISSNYFHVDNCSPLLGYVNIFKYNSAVKNLIADIKYNFLYDIVPEISTVISHRLQSDFPNILKYWQENQFVFVPVPLYSFRYNWRGFNQAEEISFHLSEQTQIPYNLFCLTRIKNNLPQVSLKNKVMRHYNTQNIFSVSHPPDKIILVDDVSTTLSTLKSAAQAIKKINPQSEIYGLTLAGHF